MSLAPEPTKLPRRAVWMMAAVLIVIPTVQRIDVFQDTAAIGRDGVMYIDQARRLANDPLKTMRSSPLHPGYELMMAAVQPLFGDGDDVYAWETAGVAVSMAWGALAGLALWALATATLGNIVWGFWAALLFSLSRKFTWLGAEVLTDMPALACMFASLAAALPASRALVRRRWRGAIGWAALAGASGALGYWARPESLVTLGAGALLLVAAQLKRRASWPILIGSCATLAVSALIVAGPYMLIIGGVTNDLRLRDFSLPDQAAGPSALMLASVYNSSTPVAVELAAKFSEALHPLLTGLVIGYLVLAVLAGIGGKRFSRLRNALPLPARDATALIALIWLLVLPPVVARYWRHGVLSHRYLELPAGMMAPLAVAFVVTVVRLVVRSDKALLRTRLERVLFWTLAIVLLLHAMGRDLHASNRHMRLGGQRVAEQARPDDVLLTNHGLIAHYSNLRHRVLVPAGELRLIRERRPDMTMARLISRKLSQTDPPVTIVAWAIEGDSTMGNGVRQVLARKGFVEIDRMPPGETDGDCVLYFRRIEPRRSAPASGAQTAPIAP